MTFGPPSDWTDERIALMKKLWLEGRSGSSIARELGVTRNAIFGKVSRLGLMRHGPVQNKPPRPSGNSKTKPLPMSKKASTRPSSTLLKVGLGECRWPMWPNQGTGSPDYPVCGDKCHILEPYCDAHSVIAYGSTKSAARYRPAAFDFSVHPNPNAARKDAA